MDTYHDARLGERIAARLEAHGLADGPLAPARPALLTRGMERIGNLARAIGTGRVTLIEGVAHV